MDLLNEQIERSSSLALGNAILVALATHPSAQAKDLANGFTDAEIGAIALHTPAVLMKVARMVIDEALATMDNPDTENRSPEQIALAEQLQQALSAKRRLNGRWAN